MVTGAHRWRTSIHGALISQCEGAGVGQRSQNHPGLQLTDRQWCRRTGRRRRARALGFNAPGSYAEFIKLSSIQEEPGATEAPDWREMVRQLVVGNEAVCRTARKALDIADDADDDPTEDLLIQRLQTHEKYAWMLRSLLQ